MAFGEVPVTCPSCRHRTVLPVAAIKRDNFYCPKCLEKIPMTGVRTTSEDDSRSQPVRKKSSRSSRR